MHVVVVLVMHGVPPDDFPRAEMAEFFRLHAQHESAQPGAGRPVSQDSVQRYAELEAKMRDWPRTPENDAFHAGAQVLAEEISRATGYEVVLGFNEFCAPSVDEALDQAAADGAEKVIIITPMMSAGGEHSEQDIPQAIARATIRHPDVDFSYAWPFDVKAVAGFLAEQVRRSL